MSENQRLTSAARSLIRYPRFNALHQDISLCQELSVSTGEPQCMVLEGVTGAGKSTLARAYAESFPRYETDEGRKVPVFYVETPSPVTIKGMAARMLQELGDPAAEKGTRWSMDARVIRFIQACEVQLVILDDFHHLIDKDTNRVLNSVSDWLKVIIKETGIPYLVVGIEGTVEPILQANAQLSRLFAVRETLRPFAWDVAQKETIEEFASFMLYAEKSIGIPLATNMDRIELIARIHFATDGVVGNITNFMRLATLLAQKRNQDVIPLEILAEAFSKRLAKHMNRENPFEAPVERSFLIPPEIQPRNAPHSVSHRVRRRARTPSVGQVLTTGG